MFNVEKIRNHKDIIRCLNGPDFSKLLVKSYETTIGFRDY